jgi:quercetin dioxygenase-like cupin family protein
MTDRIDEEGLYALALTLPAETPPPGLRDRILASLAPTSRFESFIDEIARMIDLGQDAVRGLLAKIDSAAEWVAGPPPSRLIHLPYGPRLAQVDVGFVCVPAGASFPHHRHLGDEHVLVLQGSYVDTDGTTVGRGETAHKAGGSSHAFTVPAGPDLIFLVILTEGIEIDGYGRVGAD